MQAIATLLGGTFLALLACSPAGPEPASPPHRPSPILRVSGEVLLPEGAHFEFFAIIVRDPSDADQFLGTIDIPKQALSGESLSSVRLEPGRTLSFELPFSGSPRWLGTYEEDGSIACQFRQGEHVRECTMQVVTANAREHAFED